MKRRCAILTGFDPDEFRGGIETYNRQLVDLLRGQGIAVDIYHTGHLPDAGRELPAAATRSGALFDAWRRLQRAALAFKRGAARYPERPTESFPFDTEASGLLKRLIPLGRAFYDVDRQYEFVISHAFYGFSYFPPRIPAFTILHSTHARYAEANREVLAPKRYLEISAAIGLGAERFSTIGKKVIAVSDAVAREARELYEAKTVSVVSTGIDRTVFFPRPNRAELRDRYAVPQDAFVVVFLARWGADKAIDVLQAVMAKTPDVFWLLLLGSSLAKPLAETAMRKVLTNLDGPGVAEVLSLGDALFHPARYEGFGFAYVEALACGLPVIAPPVGAMRAIGHDLPFRALLLPPYADGKERVIAGALDALDRLRHDAALSHALREAGPPLVARHFDRSRWDGEMLAALGLASAL